MFEDYRVEDCENDDDTTQSIDNEYDTIADSFDVEADSGDVSLLDEAKKKHLDAIFKKEFFPHINALYNFACKLSLDEDDANDLVQETLIKAYKSGLSFVAGSNAKSWLFKILKNTFINEYRRKKRLPQQIDHEEIGQYHDSEDPGQGKYLDLRHEIFQDMLGDEVTKALNSIPVDFRIVVLLYDVENFTYEEASKIIGKPIGTFRSRLSRGRDLLRKALHDYGKTMGYVD